jgi:hypothetical protein
VVPALLIKESILPHFEAVSFTTLLQSESFDTSDFTTKTSAPKASHSLATSFANSIELEQVIVTFHPFEDNFLATSAPTPLLEPVTIATGFF